MKQIDVSVNNWTRKWFIELNEAKSVHVDFTNKRCQHIPITINGKVIPYSVTAKLRWKAHAKKKSEELGLKYSKMHWLMGRSSALSIHNKLILYKQILKPVWTYGIQLWECTKQSNIDITHRFQNKRYLGTSLKHLGISETPISIGTFKWRWLRMKPGSSLSSMKKGFCTTSTSERSSCSTTVN